MIQAIKDAKPGSLVSDRGERASVPGLQAKKLSSGKVSFYYFYRTKSRIQRRPKLGTLGEITVAEARARAKAIATRVAAGEDPRGDWENKRTEPTVRDLFNACWTGVWSTKAVSKRWAAQVKMNWDNHLEKPFGNLKISELGPVRLRAWLAKYENSPYAGNRSLEALARMYRFGQEQELIPLGVNPCSLVKGLPERKRKRFATDEEIGRVASRLEAWAEERPSMVAFVFLLIYTGTRPSVIARATWDQLTEFGVENPTTKVVETWGRLTIRGKTYSQTGEEDEVLLPPQAMRILLKLTRIPGHTITGVTQPQKFWETIRREAGCEDLWLRDFRRTFATKGLSSGQNQGVIGELLNHKSIQTTKRYALLDDRARLEVAGSIASSIERHADAKTPPPIVVEGGEPNNGP